MPPWRSMSQTELTGSPVGVIFPNGPYPLAARLSVCLFGVGWTPSCFNRSRTFRIACETENQHPAYPIFPKGTQRRCKELTRLYGVLQLAFSLIAAALARVVSTKLLLFRVDWDTDDGLLSIFSLPNVAQTTVVVGANVSSERVKATDFFVSAGVVITVPVSQGSADPFTALVCITNQKDSKTKTCNTSCNCAALVLKVAK